MSTTLEMATYLNCLNLKRNAEGECLTSVLQMISNYFKCFRWNPWKRNVKFEKENKQKNHDFNCLFSVSPLVDCKIFSDDYYPSGPWSGYFPRMGTAPWAVIGLKWSRDAIVFIRGETLSAHNARPRKIPGLIVVVRENLSVNKRVCRK